jgi:hypothetical protein
MKRKKKNLKGKLKRKRKGHSFPISGGDPGSTRYQQEKGIRKAMMSP